MRGEKLLTHASIAVLNKQPTFSENFCGVQETRFQNNFKVNTEFHQLKIKTLLY